MAQQEIKLKVIEVGAKAPLWKGQSNHGEVNLADSIGKTPVLLIFYPADWSNVCSDELPLLEELLHLAGNIELKAFGISADTLASHKAFAHQIGLQKITLVSDFYHQISKAYGVLDTDALCKRALVLIDVVGVVRWVNVVDDKTQPHTLADLERVVQLVREWSNLPSSLEEWKHEQQFAMQVPRATPLLPPTQLQLRFWGTRGSIPVSGVSYTRYGGNTSCVSLTSDTGHLFMFDCGSGARELGAYLLSPEWPSADDPTTNNGAKTIKGYLFLSHTHWDHIQGFPFFVPVFRPGTSFNVIGWSNCSQNLASILAGQMEQCYFPVSLENLPSKLNFYSLQYGNATLDGAKIIARLLKHPIPSTAFRVELGGKIVIYATDHEPLSVPEMKQYEILGDDVIDKKLVDLARNADILIHDAQYATSQLSEKVNWGHNSPEVAVDTCIKANVKCLVLYHHDPANDDDKIDALLASARQRAKDLGNTSLEILAAYDGFSLNL